MIRILVRALIFLGSAAIGLIAAALLLDGFDLDSGGFALVVVIYAVVQMILSPFLMKFTARNAAAFMGGVGLLATFVALLVASLVGDSLTITGGAATWIAATVVVWLVTALATLLLPFALVRAGVESARAKRAD